MDSSLSKDVVAEETLLPFSQWCLYCGLTFEGYDGDIILSEHQKHMEACGRVLKCYNCGERFLEDSGWDASATHRQMYHLMRCPTKSSIGHTATDEVVDILREYGDGPDFDGMSAWDIVTVAGWHKKWWADIEIVNSVIRELQYREFVVDESDTTDYEAGLDGRYSFRYMSWVPGNREPVNEQSRKYWTLHDGFSQYDIWYNHGRLGQPYPCQDDSLSSEDDEDDDLPLSVLVNKEQEINKTNQPKTQSGAGESTSKNHHLDNESSSSDDEDDNVLLISLIRQQPTGIPNLLAELDALDDDSSFERLMKGGLKTNN